MNRVFVQVTRIAAWASRGINCLLLAGHHNQTVSSRCYENRKCPAWKFAYLAINRLFWFQQDHCRSSYIRDIEWASRILKSYHSELQDLNKQQRSSKQITKVFGDYYEG